ncbi:MAG: hypothetical protein ACE366_24020 [Bradymonadia bacterium]
MHSNKTQSSAITPSALMERYGWWVILVLSLAVIALLAPRVIAHASASTGYATLN